VRGGFAKFRKRTAAVALPAEGGRYRHENEEAGLKRQHYMEEGREKAAVRVVKYIVIR
jgi:hypothetical protein